MAPKPQSDPWARLVQIFSAKLVLEVFGAGGAIWGFSEAATFRYAETNEFFRKFALIIATIFTARFCLQIKDFIEEMIYGGTPSVASIDKKTRLFQIFAAKFVLEFLGGAGAIWGYSEVCTFRNPETVHTWRFYALTVGLVFFIRWLLQIKDFITDYDVEAKSDPFVRLFQIFSAKLVLEVFGGGGAIWGFSEVLTLRRPETQEFWRHNAQIAAFIFFVRFSLQINDFLIEHDIDQAKIVRLLQIFSAKLVLEVFGAAGAIWGFSETMTWRRPETQEFWRHNAMIVGVIFTVRFFMQIKDFLDEAMEEGVIKKKAVEMTEHEQTPLVC